MTRIALRDSFCEETRLIELTDDQYRLLTWLDGERLLDDEVSYTIQESDITWIKI